MIALKMGLHGRARITMQVKKLAVILKREEKAAIKSWEPSLTRAFETFGNKIAEGAPGDIYANPAVIKAYIGE